MIAGFILEGKCQQSYVEQQAQAAFNLDWAAKRSSSIAFVSS